MGLLNNLKQKPFCNDVHFFLIGMMLLILGLKYYFILIFLFLYLFFIFKRTNYIIPILILLISTLSIITTLKLIRDNNIKEDYTGVIEEIDNDNYIINTGLYKVKCYEYNHTYNVGDVVDIKIEHYDNNKSYEYDFDNLEYLYSKNISYSGKVIKSNYKYTIPSIYSLKHYYLKYLNNHLSSESYKYTEALIFGDNNLDSDIKDAYSVLGISHILAISGFHIIIIFKLISFILLKLFHYHGDLLPNIILGLFVLFIGFPPSALRAWLFLVITSLNKKGRIHYTKLDILSVSAILMILNNPYILFSTSFILSFLVSFILLYTSDFIKGNNNLLNKYKIYIIMYLSTLPFVLRITNVISLLSFLLSPILSLFIGYIILPTSIILSIFPVLDIFLKYIFIFIDAYLINLSNYGYLIHVETFNIYKIIIYYVILTLFLVCLSKEKHRIISGLLLTLYLALVICFRYVDLFNHVTFIDVGQGDSALIELKQNRGNIVIDAYNSYDFLKRKGLRRIDYLVLTHSDNDHVKDAKKIYDYFDVKMIIYPKYDGGFKSLIGQYPNKEMVDYTSKINIDDFSMDVLGPINEYKDKNSNSVVLKIKIDDYDFLFTGDMEEDEELDLVNIYHNYLKADVLKVGHHGSNTSSSELFLNYVKPKYSVISVGLNNKYGHPNKEVLERLSKYSEIYKTSICGNITFNIINDKLNISTYR